MSIHAADVAAERAIPQAWITRAIDLPDVVEERADGTTHFLKSIAEHGNRVLRVFIRASANELLVVRVFFDRRMKGRLR